LVEEQLGTGLDGYSASRKVCSGATELFSRSFVPIIHYSAAKDWIAFEKLKALGQLSLVLVNSVFSEEAGNSREQLREMALRVNRVYFAEDEDDLCPSAFDEAAEWTRMLEHDRRSNIAAARYIWNRHCGESGGLGEESFENLARMVPGKSLNAFAGTHSNWWRTSASFCVKKRQPHRASRTHRLGSGATKNSTFGILIANKRHLRYKSSASGLECIETSLNLSGYPLKNSKKM
jgi:hypothetical protein